MTQSKNLAKHLKSIFFGGNWADVNVKDAISKISLNDANQNIECCNSIASLVFHINYYIKGILPVFDGSDLTIRDTFSYDAPNFTTEQQWENFKTSVLENAKILYEKITQLDDNKIFSPFVEEKYGSYYSNIHGIIEHTHYHLGQIVILKKLIDNKLAN